MLSKIPFPRSQPVSPRLPLLLASLLLLTAAACSGGDGAGGVPRAAAEGGEAAPPAPSSGLSATAAARTDSDAEAGAKAAAERRDLLSWAEAAFVVRGPEPASSGAAAVLLDGDPATVPIGIPRREPLPHELVVELPARTTFETFAVPEIDEYGPKKGKHVRTVEIAGSTQGPEAGFSPLATLRVEVGAGGPQEFPVAEPRPVRWLKIRLVDQSAEPRSDVDPALFSELEGYGRQEERSLGDGGLSGVWRLRRAGKPSPNLIELRQDGTLVSGCQIVGGVPAEISGTMDGIGRLVITPTTGDRAQQVPALATVTRDGEVHGVYSLYSGLQPFSGTPAEPGTETPCSEQAEAKNAVSEALEAGLTAVIYGIHFDTDSDRLRSDAAPALEQLLAALEASPGLAVTIEGHTDSDASDEHNLDLSRRRAQAVTAWLTERGVEEGRLTAEGKGEAEPVASNDSSAGKAMNRRVEVEPS